MRSGIQLVVLLAAVALFAGCSQRTEWPNPVAEAAVVKELRAADAPTKTEGAAPSSTGWGALKGTVVFVGDPPAAGNIATSGDDAAKCGQVPNLSLLVDGGTKGIANVVVFARKVSRVHDDAKQAKEPSVVFDQEGCKFLSPLLAMHKGQKLIVKNSDKMGHNTKADPGGQPGFNQSIGPGAQFEWTFIKKTEMPFNVACSIHPWMGANMLVRDDMYYAVTNAKGEFEIANLPAGEKIIFQVWHARAADLSADAGADGRVKSGRITLDVPEGGVKTIAIQAPAASFQ